MEAPLLLQQDHKADLVTFRRVATFRSPFHSCFGCPRQGAPCPSVVGRIDLSPDLSADFLRGLEDFSHVWVLFLFDRNESKLAAAGGEAGMEQTRKGSSAPGKQGGERKAQEGHAAALKSTVRPPRLQHQQQQEQEQQTQRCSGSSAASSSSSTSTGVFATRAPHRPNSIGMTVMKIDRVENKSVFVSGVDVVDGTFIVDLKPYHILDAAPVVDIVDDEDERSAGAGDSGAAEQEIIPAAKPAEPSAGGAASAATRGSRSEPEASEAEDAGPGTDADAEMSQDVVVGAEPEDDVGLEVEVPPAAGARSGKRRDPNGVDVVGVLLAGAARAEQGTRAAPSGHDNVVPTGAGALSGPTRKRPRVVPKSFIPQPTATKAAGGEVKTDADLFFPSWILAKQRAKRVTWTREAEAQLDSLLMAPSTATPSFTSTSPSSSTSSSTTTSSSSSSSGHPGTDSTSTTATTARRIIKKNAPWSSPAVCGLYREYFDAIDAGDERKGARHLAATVKRAISEVIAMDMRTHQHKRNQRKKQRTVWAFFFDGLNVLFRIVEKLPGESEAFFEVFLVERMQEGKNTCWATAQKGLDTAAAKNECKAASAVALGGA